MQWVASHKNDRNNVFVASLGDNVDIKDRKRTAILLPVPPIKINPSQPQMAPTGPTKPKNLFLARPAAKGYAKGLTNQK